MTCSPNHTKLKFIDLTKEIEDCSKDQNLSMYHCQSTSTSNGQLPHPGSQRKKINKRFRNNPGFASNFFFFPSSVAVNGNTSANMAIHKDGSIPSSTENSSTVETPRRWSLHSKPLEKNTAANASEGAPASASQDDKGNAIVIEDGCHSVSHKKSPPASRGKRSNKGRLQRRFSCSDYLPSKSTMTEQDLATIESIYSPMSSYCITPNSQFVNFTLSSPDAPSQQSPTTVNTIAFNNLVDSTADSVDKVVDFEEEWDFLDPNSKKRRPSFDMNQDEMDKLFNAFTFEPIRDLDHTQSSSSGVVFETDSTDETNQDTFNLSSIEKISEDQLMNDNALIQDSDYSTMLQDFQEKPVISTETELLFNSLPEDMKQQLVSFFLLQNNTNGESSESAEGVDNEAAAPKNPTEEAETKETEKRSTSTTQEIDNMLESVSDQPLFEPITEIGLSELKEFGLFDDLEEATLRPSTSNDDFENFLNNL